MAHGTMTGGQCHAHNPALRIMLLCGILSSCCSVSLEQFHTSISLSERWVRFDGIGGLSGGGATSNFIESYDSSPREAIMDWLFTPNFGASLDILKVEIGADDQTTDGCEACHMRSPTDLNCSRGYEWTLMRHAADRNPDITLVGLPWGFPGWLGFNTSNPYHNVSATADYITKWVECGRDVHNLNISVLGLWNEAWQAAGRPWSEPWDYVLALRARLDSSGLGHVRIIAPDGDIGSIAADLQRNDTYRNATWGLGQHYPGARGTTDTELSLRLPLWSSEDYSTYSDATGAGCWARLLVQNAGWGYGATISWYLLGSFSRGMDYDSDGFLRAAWPTSGHWEVTPMLWITMHWTLFTESGWDILRCNADVAANTDSNAATPCALTGGGNYATLVSPTGANLTFIVEAFTHQASRCIRNDPPDWTVAQVQTVTLSLPPTVVLVPPERLAVWRSCTGWRYPADDDSYMERLPDLHVTAYGSTRSVTFDVEQNCYYTVTTVRDRIKPSLPLGNGTSLDSFSDSISAPSAAFPLPYFEDFEGPTAGGEAKYFGDQQGKWETVAAGGGRRGRVSQQQLPLAPWPILEPQCNDHGAPISIIGDMFFESTRVAADVLLLEPSVGAGLALRIRNDHLPVPPSPGFFRGGVLGLFLYIGATPGLRAEPVLGRINPGGQVPPPNSPINGWALCVNSFCTADSVLARGVLPRSSPPLFSNWHAVALEVTDNMASGKIDNVTIFDGITVSRTMRPDSPQQVARCVTNTTVWTDRVIAGGDYRQLPVNASADDPLGVQGCAHACCSESVCVAWAVAAGKCWLKNGGVVQMRTGEDACGFKPQVLAPKGADVPPSGWAALIATLGRTQFDNFRLAGTAAGGAAAPPCPASAGASPREGTMLSSAPCDYPGALTQWVGTNGFGAAALALRSSSSRELCIGWLQNAASHSGPEPSAPSIGIGLVACSAASALHFDASTGRLIAGVNVHVGASIDTANIRTGPGGAPDAGNATLCLTAVQRQRFDPELPPLSLAPCGSIPDNAQQFQWNPRSGALRQKGSHCVAAFPSGVAQYRDCCVALCSS